MNFFYLQYQFIVKISLTPGCKIIHWQQQNLNCQRQRLKQGYSKWPPVDQIWPVKVCEMAREDTATIIFF